MNFYTKTTGDDFEEGQVEILNPFLLGVKLSIKKPNLLKNIIASGKENMTLLEYKKYKKDAIDYMKRPLGIADLAEITGSYL